MKIIELLSEHIEDELEDACAYAKLALEYKDTDPETAALFHKRVVASIDTYKKLKGEPPEGMKALYDFMHKREIAQAEKVTTLQGMFKK